MTMPKEGSNCVRSSQHVYLWADGQKEGPLPLETVHSRLKHGVVHAGTLFSIGGDDDWKPLSDLPQAEPSSLSATPRADRFFAGQTGNPQRSAWSSFLRIAGGLLVAIGSLICVARLVDGKAAWEMIGLVAIGISAFFWAFLVDVLTDIRAYLRDLRDR